MSCTCLDLARIKGFLGLAWICSILRCIRLWLSECFRFVLHVPYKHVTTLNTVTLTGVILCLCCLEILNNSAKSSSSTQRKSLNYMGDTPVEGQLHSCLDAEAVGMPKHNATQLFQDQAGTKKCLLLWEQHTNVNVLCCNSYARNNILAEMFLVKLCNIDVLYWVCESVST